MADKLFEGPSQGFKAITINGAIVVETPEDVRKRQERRAKRKSRWDGSSGPKTAKIESGNGSNLPEKVKDNPVAWRERSMALPATMDVSKMDEKNQKIYLLRMQIQESSMKLGRSDLGIPQNPRDRSPSPEPIYNNKGVRINTRPDRVRNRLINQRNQAITRLKELDPSYQPPSNFNYKNAELEDKVLIPAEENPHINFLGLILGPRGRQLEEIKAETNTHIVIRGKGSLKSGMTGLTKDGKKFEGLEEPLHALITGKTAEEVKKASKKIQDLIDMEVYNPESEKAVALRAKHMYELAVINGTLREVDMKCLNCGRSGHQTWQCSDSKIYTSAVICSACGGVGHLTSDCQQRRPGAIFSKGKADPKVIDKEYEAFVDDMGPTCSKSLKAKVETIPAISGGIGGNGGVFRDVKAPLMLTNGSAAPGAASAHARALSNPQTAGGALQGLGTSIFGGKLTRMTSGYKTAEEIEREKEKKKEEHANRPVPLAWQVERFEKAANKQHEEYLKRLELQHIEEKRLKEKSASLISAARSSIPPPPPPGSGGSLMTQDLPDLNSNPWEFLKKNPS